MKKLRYGVFPIDSQWLVCSEEQNLGRFADRSSAVAEGKRAARTATGCGFDVELLVMDVGGELRQIAPGAFGH
jgi:hypothetical protein